MRKRIGFLIDWIDSDYHVNLLSGIEIGACAYDFDVFTFIGGVFEDSDRELVCQSDVFSFVTPQTVDAVIISTSTLSYSGGNSWIRELCASLQPFPIVSISAKIDGIPSIIINNKNGFNSLVSHLVNVHSYRRFIYITGQKHIDDSIERLNIFISSLKEFDISIEDQLILPGDFSRDSGYENIIKMSNRAIMDYDVIMAANDEMAWGAFDALREKGIKVPEDIALTGFDDQMISKYMNPPLTTVKQPIMDMGYRAIEFIADILEGKSVPLIEYMETEMMVRRTCGCGINRHFFEQELGDYSSNYLQIENEFIQFRAISQKMVKITNIEELIELLEKDLSRINISFCLFALYNGEDLKHHNNKEFRIIFAYMKNKGMIQSLKGLSYPAKELFPNSVFSGDEYGKIPVSLIIEPIFFGKKPLGVIFIDLNKRNEVMYNIMLRMFINTALKAAFFVQEVQSKAYLVEEANNKLTKALKELQMTKIQAIESEKMAALGKLVAGMAHEINTPIGISVTASSLLERLTAELEKKFRDNTLKKSDMEHYIERAREASLMVLSNMQRSHELISSFKNVAVDQSVEEMRHFNVKTYIQEILTSMQPQLKKAHHIIDVECSPILHINGYPGAIYQILSNLIMNSIIHAFPGNEQGIISIKMKRDNNALHLEFSDNGCGIPDDDQKHIFEPFFTTKRAQGGTGLGLNLVYNLVKHKLNGEIFFKSKINEGTIFYIAFPVEYVDE